MRQKPATRDQFNLVLKHMEAVQALSSGNGLFMTTKKRNAHYHNLIDINFEPLSDSDKLLLNYSKVTEEVIQGALKKEEIAKPPKLLNDLLDAATKANDIQLVADIIKVVQETKDLPIVRAVTDIKNSDTRVDQKNSRPNIMSSSEKLELIIKHQYALKKLSSEYSTFFRVEMALLAMEDKESTIYKGLLAIYNSKLATYYANLIDKDYNKLESPSIPTITKDANITLASANIQEVLYSGVQDQLLTGLLHTAIQEQDFQLAKDIIKAGAKVEQSHFNTLAAVVVSLDMLEVFELKSNVQLRKLLEANTLKAPATKQKPSKPLDTATKTPERVDFDTDKTLKVMLEDSLTAIIKIIKKLKPSFLVKNAKFKENNNIVYPL